MKGIDDQSKILKPNSFEYSGNLAIKKKLLTRDQPYSLCLNLPVMTVITVNKVQDLYNTPVYKIEVS